MSLISICSDTQPTQLFSARKFYGIGADDCGEGRDEPKLPLCVSLVKANILLIERALAALKEDSIWNEDFVKVSDEWRKQLHASKEVADLYDGFQRLAGQSMPFDCVCITCTVS